MRLGRANVTACLVQGIAVFVTCASEAAESIRFIGSERMEPMVRVLAEQYGKGKPEVTFDIRGGGSSAGVPALANGQAAIAMLARPATELERNYVRNAARKELIGVPVAMDAVVLVVATENPIKSLTLAQIQAIFSYELTRWGELGVTPGAFPAGAHLPRDAHGHTEGLVINRYLPARTSGSVEVLETGALNGKRLAFSPNQHERTAELIKVVAADPLGIGFGGRSHVDGVKVLAVQADAESPPVSPTPSTLRDRSYPLSHYLYFYFAGQPEGEVRDFLAFVVSADGQRAIADSATGLVALPLIGGPFD